MNITIPFAAQLHLERLIDDLQTHYYALRLCVEDDDKEWSDTRNWLIYTRVDKLENTVQDLCAFEHALSVIRYNQRI